MGFLCEIYFEKCYYVLCQKENKQYILQDRGDGHLGFMHEQDPKIKNNMRNDFLIRNSQVVLRIVFCGHLRFMHEQDIKIKNTV